VRPLLIAVTGLVLAVGSAGATSETHRIVVRLTLDGALVRPELALTSDARSLGLMNRRKPPADGMLFVFPEPTTGGFWMKDTLVPLTIAFFNADGERVRKLSMTPCRTASCPIYEPRRTYRFALELRASDMRPAKQLGPLRALRRLVRQAR